MSTQELTPYQRLEQALQAIDGIPFAEYEWSTRPAGTHGTYQIDFEAGQDDGEDEKQDRALQGSIDLYTQGSGMAEAAKVEAALKSVCGPSWYLNSQAYDSGVRMVHREYVFEVEEDEP